MNQFVATLSLVWQAIPGLDSNYEIMKAVGFEIQNMPKKGIAIIL
jgi:hypothetical protein